MIKYIKIVLFIIIACYYMRMLRYRNAYRIKTEEKVK